jgi:hypothetical protein
MYNVYRAVVYNHKMTILIEEKESSRIQRKNSGTAFSIEIYGHKLRSSQSAVLSCFLPSFFHSTVQSAIHE